VTFNPYVGLSKAKLRGLRRDAAKLIHASVSARKAGERQITLVNNALREAREGVHEVSDHAVVRYLERVRGVDVDAIRDEISSACESAERIVGDYLRARDGVIYCVNSESNVTTVLPLDAVIEEAERNADEMASATSQSAKRKRRVRAKREFAREAREMP
jgi:hypothetical protein